MLPNLNDFHRNLILTGANHYLNQGYSVMPLVSDTKFPGLASWANLQQRPITAYMPPSKIEKLFEKYTNLAIITGRISKLLVLDFDNYAVFTAFKEQLTAFTHTYTVQTARGYHLYFHVPDIVTIDLKRVTGQVDIQWEGRYVVAPPSIVDGHQYSVIDNTPPHTLTQNEVETLKKHLNPVSKSAQIVPVLPENDHKMRSQDTFGHLDFVGMYKHFATQHGRNNALFRTACIARDHGFDQNQTINLLIDAHISHKPIGKHRRETPHQRKREGEGTITSAFSRAARPVSNRSQHLNGLSNVIIEALFGQKLTCVVRTLAGLRQRGYMPGQVFTADEAREALAEIVGRDGVFATLNWLEKVSPEPPSKFANAVASDKSNDLNKKCTLFRVKKSGISRPIRHFVMPSNSQLAGFLGIQNGAVFDDLPLDCLKSARLLRMTYHERFIRRKPGKYVLSILAMRLGVTRRTVQNYHNLLKNVIITPQYSEQPVFWSNYEAIIDDEFCKEGYFLANEYGKRFHAKQGIARHLLGKKQRITLFRQEANHYHYGDVIMIPEYGQNQTINDQNQTLNRPVYAQNTPTYIPEQKRSANAQLERSSRPKNGANLPQFATDTPEQVEQMAQKLYKAINALPTERGGKLSLTRARGMVTEHGVNRVENALKQTLSRRNLHKPAGFISTILRSEKRARELDKLFSHLNR